MDEQLQPSNQDGHADQPAALSSEQHIPRHSSRAAGTASSAEQLLTPPPAPTLNEYPKNFSWEGFAQPEPTEGTPSKAPHFGRIGILNITPNLENGYAPRLELGEAFTASANVFIEGRSIVGADAVLRNPRGRVHASRRMSLKNAGLDEFEVVLRAGKPSNVLPWDKKFTSLKHKLGTWSLIIEGWEDVFAEWFHDARIKVSLDDDIYNTLIHGAQIIESWMNSRDSHLSDDERKTLSKAVRHLQDESAAPLERFDEAMSAKLLELHELKPYRTHITKSEPIPLTVERPHSSAVAWYQFFPRSEGAYHDPETHELVPGTFKTAISGLERAKAQGFNVAYLPPIFPIGTTNRKGRDGALKADPDDPGSPWGIGSELGGHDTLNPQLGSMEDFRAFVAASHRLGIEVALDFALQCSPDHPWVKEHPQWFRHNPDGSIAFAENPPKKYQDIYPLDFDDDETGIRKEVVRILEHWISEGVTVFRVDNPHTKPVRFWQSVIAEVNRAHPEVLFLAEAFTRPSMMRALSYAGFTQSHSYFPWRNTKQELNDYLYEVSGAGSQEGFHQHNTFWPTTPDILTDFIRDNGIAGHAIRAILAALGSPSWGIYSGYELIENEQRIGSEEQAHNEKYEIKARDWSEASEFGISELLTRLNEIRGEHECLHSFHTLSVHGTDSDSIVAFSRYIPAELSSNGKPDAVIVVVNLDGHDAHQATVNLDLNALGLDEDAHFTVHEELTGQDFEWGRSNYVSLAPWSDVAHILTVRY
jgi:starch synthase (maltosyl-transferring)